MKRKRRKTRKSSFIKNLFKNPVVSKVIGAIIVAFASYILNHLQTIGTINQLKVDNNELNWAVDYFRR